MKKLFTLFVLALVMGSVSFAQVNVTFRVTLKGTGKRLHSGGMRVTGALGSTAQADWSPSAAGRMALVGATSDSIYAITIPVTRPANGVIEYKFVNGDNWGDGSAGGPEDERALTATCAKAANDNRVFTIPTGVTAVTIPAYRFNTCQIVFATNVNELSTAGMLQIAPNPMSDRAVLYIENPSNEMHAIDVISATGQVVRSIAPTNAEQVSIEKANLSAGMYIARIRNAKGESSSLKFIIE